MAKTTKAGVVNLFNASEGNLGVRIIPFAAETDRIAAKHGLEENVEVMTNKELLESAKKEAMKAGYIAWDKENKKWIPGWLYRKVEYRRMAEFSELMEKREAITEKGEELVYSTTVRSEQAQYIREYRAELAEFDALNKGVLKDFTADVGEALNPNWVTWTQGDEATADADEGFILPEDDRSKEVNIEREDKVTPRLEKKNFEHLDWLKNKRDSKFNSMKLDIMAAGRESWKLKNIALLERWERQIHRVRDCSFEQKLLNMITPVENQNRAYWLTAPKHIKDLYESSRMLNFEQHQQLIDLINVLKVAVQKRQKPSLNLLEMLWNLRQQGSKLMKDKEITHAQKISRVDVLNRKIAALRGFIGKEPKEIETAVKAAGEVALIQSNINQLDRKRIVANRDVMREKWAYYRDMILELRSVEVENLDIFEQEDLLMWANAKLAQVEIVAKAYVAKHNILPTETIENA